MSDYELFERLSYQPPSSIICDQCVINESYIAPAARHRSVPHPVLPVDWLIACWVTCVIDWLYSGASPKMRDAIQGMLSMSRGSRLLPGTALLRTQSSSSAAQLFRRRSSFPVTDDIDKKLMSCYNDNEFGKSSSCIDTVNSWHEHHET